MSNDDQIMLTDGEAGDIQDETWLPRHSVRDTNWMYRVAVLRTHDYREMEVQVYQSLALLCNAIKALVYTFSFRYTMLDGSMATLHVRIFFRLYIFVYQSHIIVLSIMFR